MSGRRHIVRISNKELHECYDLHILYRTYIRYCVYNTKDSFRVSHWMVSPCLLFIYTAFFYYIHGSQVEPHRFDSFDVASRDCKQYVVEKGAASIDKTGLVAKKTNTQVLKTRVI